MKKYLALFLVLVLSLSVTAALAEETIQMDKLTFQFVPSKDADVIIAGTEGLPPPVPLA